MCVCVYSEQELEEGEGGEGVTMATPDFAQLDELGHSAQGSQDACVSLIEQIRTAMNEVIFCPIMLLDILLCNGTILYSFQKMWSYYGD